MEAELSRSWARVLVAEAAHEAERETERETDADAVARRTPPGASSIVAFVTYWIVADEIHVLTVATDPAHRRRGVARTLIDSLLADANERGSRTVLLEVRAGNDAAIGLYRAMGFVESGTRLRYYDDGEDARLMQRLLEPDTEPKRET